MNTHYFYNKIFNMNPIFLVILIHFANGINISHKKCTGCYNKVFVGNMLEVNTSKTLFILFRNKMKKNFE